MPTLCDLLGAECPQEAAGRSLLAPGAEPRRFLTSEGVMTRPGNRAVRDGRYKLIHEPEGRRDARDAAGPTSLYRLDAAGFEGSDLLAAEQVPPAVAERRERLWRALDEGVVPFDAPTPERVPVDPDMRERLRELGYVEE